MTLVQVVVDEMVDDESERERRVGLPLLSKQNQKQTRRTPKNSKLGAPEIRFLQARLCAYSFQGHATYVRVMCLNPLHPSKDSHKSKVIDRHVSKNLAKLLHPPQLDSTTASC